MPISITRVVIGLCKNEKKLEILKKLELPLAIATFTLLSCSPNFPGAP